MRRYIGLDVLARCRIAVLDGEQNAEEVPLAAITAWSPNRITRRTGSHTTPSDATATTDCGSNSYELARWVELSHVGERKLTFHEQSGAAGDDLDVGVDRDKQADGVLAVAERIEDHIVNLGRSLRRGEISRPDSRDM
jgi:hypothetical protein